MIVELLSPELREQIDVSEWGESELPDDIEAYGIVEDGELIAWYLIQRQQVHCGPFHVKHERRGYAGGLLALDATKRTPLKGTYIAATTEESTTLCRKMGMTEIAGKLFTR